MKTEHETKYGKIILCLHGGKYIPQDAKYGRREENESSGYFEATRENPVTVNGIPYSFTFHFKYGGNPATDSRYLNWGGQYRWEHFYSTRLDENYSIDGMTENARKRIYATCKELFDTLTPEDFRDAEITSFRSHIERLKGELHDTEEKVIALKVKLRAEFNRFADTFGIIQNETFEREEV